MRIDILATEEDLIASLRAVDAIHAGLHYIELGQKRDPSFAVYTKYDQIVGLGWGADTRAGGNWSYEVCRAGTYASEQFNSLWEETSPGFGVYQSNFPHHFDSIYFCPSYRYTPNPKFIVPGVISDTGSLGSKKLLTEFKSAFLKGYRKSRCYYIGPNALRSAKENQAVLLSMQVGEREDQHVPLPGRE